MSATDTIFTRSAFTRLAETTAQYYLPYGRFVHGFVRGKLLHDPMFEAILALKLVPEQGHILDLGCGRGILLSLISTVMAAPALAKLSLSGIELRPKDSNIARLALGHSATIVTGDICLCPFPPSNLVLLLDVLLYLQPEQQEAVLVKVKSSIDPKGLLVIREADAVNGFRFRYTRFIERLCALSRFNWKQQPHYRRRQDWQTLLESLDFEVESMSMSHGTFFANVLFIARPRIL